MKKLALILALMAGPSSASDVVHPFVQGEGLYGLCTNGDETAEQACAMVIIGIASAHNYAWSNIELIEPGPISDIIKEAFKPICAPVSASPEQLNAVFVKYVDDYPEKRHHSASFLVASALSEAFPCE